ncbi:MAG: ABC transporter permease [Thermoleophilia bacterium]
MGLTAAAMIIMIVITALLVPILPLQDPVLPDYEQSLQSPGTGHLLGTDLHGRDQLSRVLWASRTSLLVGIVATGLALAAGLTVGALAIFGGRYIDQPLMRVTDVFLSFPAVLGAVAIMAVFGPGRRNVFIAVAFFSWPVFARVFRASALSIRETEFVRASRGLGAGETRIFFHHVLPNSITPIVSYAAVAVAGAILAEAGLSFINLGVQRPNPSWGLMLSESMGLFEQAPWLVIVPGIAVTTTTLAFILLGVAATRALDPKMKQAGC